MHRISRRLVAELFGTFTLVYIGAGSVLADKFPKGGFGLVGISLAHGLALAIGVTATMAISGGHLNPAVTAGLLAVRRIDAKTAGLYVVAQLVGAVLAAYALQATFPPGVTKVLAIGTPSLAATMTTTTAIFTEAMLTFLLVSAVMGTVVSAEAPRVGGFGVGLTLAMAVLVGGPLTGAALNPARAFGPALVSGQWISQGVYWVGPIVGGILAAILWEKVLFPRSTD